ncbi:MAG: T9SS type A sorting domain-containing protein, partial [Chitinophagales bacterium]
HADKHTIEFNPFNPAEMLIGCDGGLFRTGNADDVYPIFSDLNRNYNVTQTYSASAAPTGEVIAGCQDNGTQYIDFLGNTPMAANEIQGGDGGNTEIGRLNPNAFFAEFPAGTVTRSSSKGTGFNTFYDDRIDASGDGTIDEGADWLTAFTLWEQPDTARSYYALGAGLSTGHVWFTKGAMDFGLDPDWFRFPVTTGWVTCVAFSKDGNSLFAGTSSGYLYRYSNILAVDDSGKFVYPSISSTASAWNAVDSGITVSSVLVASGRYLRWIAVDPTDASKVVVTGARYGNDQNIWRSTNALDSIMTFSDITDNLPKMPVWTAVVDLENPNRIIIGTDLGVYGRDMSNSDGWSEENGGMARVPVMTIKQIPYYGKPYLYIGTYGRGVYRTGSLVGINEAPAVINNMMLFPNPVQDQATLRISLAKGSPVEIRIYNLSGELVQQIQQKNLTAGENTININTGKLNSGTYIVNAKSGTSSFNQKMVVIR